MHSNNTDPALLLEKCDQGCNNADNVNEASMLQQREKTYSQIKSTKKDHVSDNTIYVSDSESETEILTHCDDDDPSTVYCKAIRNAKIHRKNIVRQGKKE